MKTCSFIGHSDLWSIHNSLKNNLRAMLRIEIKKMIDENGVRRFLNGGQGDFDEICAEAVHEIIFNRDDIASYLVNPYETKNLAINKDHINHLFSKSFVPRELADSDICSSIPKKNHIIVDNSNYIIAFVSNNFGGAYKSLQYARKKSHIKIINLSQKT